MELGSSVKKHVDVVIRQPSSLGVRVQSGLKNPEISEAGCKLPDQEAGLKNDQMCPLLAHLSRNSRIFTAHPLEGLANCCESIYLPSVGAPLWDSPVLTWRS